MTRYFKRIQMNIPFNKSKRQACSSFCIAVGLSLFATSCNTSSQSTRITEQSSEFRKLSVNDQKEVEKGAIAEGFTFEMVYMALGTPSDIETSADAMQTKWTYRNFYPNKKISDDSIYRKPPRVKPLERSLRKWKRDNREVIQIALDSQREYVQRLRAPIAGLPDTPAVKLEVVFQDNAVSEYLINGQKV